MFPETFIKYLTVIWTTIIWMEGDRLIRSVIVNMRGRIVDKLLDALEDWIRQLIKNKTTIATVQPSMPAEEDKAPTETDEHMKYTGNQRSPHRAIKWGVVVIFVLALISRLYPWNEARSKTASRDLCLVFEKDNSTFPLGNLLPNGGKQTAPLKLDSAMQMRLPKKWLGYKGLVTLQVPEKSTLNLRLSDGTLAYLDASTSLGFVMPFGSENRELILKGQAYIQTRPYQGQGLKVRGSNVIITTTKASFNFSAYDNSNPRISVLEDTVWLCIQKGGELSKPVEIAAGDEVTVDLQTGELFQPKKFDKGRVLAWCQASKYIFDREPLAEVFKTAQRHYGIPIVIEDPEMVWYPYTGYLDKTNSLDYFLENLNHGLNATVVREYRDGKIYVRLQRWALFNQSSGLKD